MVQFVADPDVEDKVWIYSFVLVIKLDHTKLPFQFSLNHPIQESCKLGCIFMKQ